MRKGQAFSIIELLVVISVISILIGIILPRFKGMQDEANKAKAKAELKTIQTALESWYTNHSPHAYPSETTALCSEYLNSASPLIIDQPLYDPFRPGNTEYMYYLDDLNGQYYIVASIGPDQSEDIDGIDDAGVPISGPGDDIYVTNGPGYE